MTGQPRAKASSGGKFSGPKKVTYDSAKACRVKIDQVSTRDEAEKMHASRQGQAAPPSPSRAKDCRDRRRQRQCFSGLLKRRFEQFERQQKIDVVFVSPELRQDRMVIRRYSVLLADRVCAACTSVSPKRGVGCGKIRIREGSTRKKRSTSSLPALRADNDRGGAAQHGCIKRVAMLPVAVGGNFRKPRLQAMLEVPDHDHVGHLQHLAGRAELPDKLDAGGLKLLVQRSPSPRRLASAEQGAALCGLVRIKGYDLGVRQRLRWKFCGHIGGAKEDEAVPRRAPISSRALKISA